MLIAINLWLLANAIVAVWMLCPNRFWLSLPRSSDEGRAAR